jgi:hypothetical protein
MTGGSEKHDPICTTCGQYFRVPAERADTAAALIEEESARCARLREIAQQRQALAARIQAGIAGVLGSDRIDTNDLVAQRQSLAQLEATLKAEEEELSRGMLHTPAGL